MRAPAMTAVLLAAAALGAAGCTQQQTNSADDFEGRQKQVAEAVDDIAAAARRADAKKICDSYLSAAYKRRLQERAAVSKRGTSCEDQLEDSIRDADAFDLKVQDVKVEGNTATVRVETTTSQERDPVDTIRMVDQRGWRLEPVE